MKLLNILGAVIAVHIAVLVLAIMIPGCSSTSPAPTDNTAPGAVFPAPSGSSASNSNATMGNADLNPPFATQVDDNGYEALSPQPVATTTSGGRATPTRPFTPAPLDSTPVINTQAAPERAPAESYTVQRGDSLWSVAKRNGLTVRELASANNIAPDSGLQLGQTLLIPGKVTAPAASGDDVGNGATANPAAATASQSYTIRPGDTLGKIARQHGVTVAELKAFNRLRSDMVRAGDTLSIPVKTATTAASPAATSSGTDTTAAASAQPAATASTYRHTVARGESLTVIAQRYGVRVGDIALANKIRDPSLIRVGQQLVIPGWEDPAATTSQDAPVTTLPATPVVGGDTAPVPSSNDDLDAGLDDDDLSTVPVLSVEEVKTIGGEADGNSPAPIFE